MAEFANPHLIQFPKLGEPGIGYISVAEQSQPVPFAVRRTFWTYHTPESIVRGRHAHYATEQVLVAVAGCIVVVIEQPTGKVETFVLDRPDIGVYIPPCCWRTMQYSSLAVQLVFASTTYDEDDYIWDYDKFKSVC